MLHGRRLLHPELGVALAAQEAVQVAARVAAQRVRLQRLLVGVPQPAGAGEGEVRADVRDERVLEAERRLALAALEGLAGRRRLLPDADLCMAVPNEIRGRFSTERGI